MTKTQQRVKEIEAAIKDLEQIAESFGDCDWGRYEHRRQDAIERKLEDLDYELRSLEGKHYNDLAEVHS